VDIVVPNWKIHRRIGMNGKPMVLQLIRQPEVNRKTVKVGSPEAKHDAAFDKAVSDIRLLPGAGELLRYLSQSGIRWAIATTGNRKQTTRLLRDLKVPPHTVVITGNDVIRPTPLPMYSFSLRSAWAWRSKNVLSLATTHGTCLPPDAGERWT
jgi:phosphoglycolate phosphatase-like HAD superfamily hydrolase